MRRSFRFVFAFAVVLGLAIPLAAQFPPPFEKPYTADSLWKDLMKGNALYHGGALPYTQLDEARKATVEKQNPPVTVLSCSDSRVPAELVFGRGVGDLFVVRAAGNVADVFGIASIEYGIAKGWTKVIVVLGHESCGAVEAALEKKDPSTPSLRALVRRIRRSFTGIDRKAKDIRPAVIANAKASADYLVSASKVIRDAVRKKQVVIIVAYYELESGEVTKIR
jgi:carbonic anhydrase